MSVTIKPPLNIHSWAKTPFAAALSLFTQSARKSGVLTQDYSIEFRGKIFPCAGTAYRHFHENLDEDEAFELLIEVMSTKLKQYPKLTETITLSGGIDWLKTCFHEPDSGNKFWQGTGYRSGYITALINAYREVAQPPEKIVSIKDEQLIEDRHDDRQKLSNRVFYNPISFELYILFNNKIKAREWGIHLIKKLYVGEGFTIQDSSDRDMKFELVVPMVDKTAATTLVELANFACRPHSNNPKDPI
ncbi:MAG: hypothetical protein RLZZ535_2317 [Cyanobacteriota bacterium]|jgi:hypothetical protein